MATLSIQKELALIVKYQTARPAQIQITAKPASQATLLTLVQLVKEFVMVNFAHFKQLNNNNYRLQY